MSKELVLVTGGAGFIGTHVVDLLLAKGYRVRVYDKLVEQVHRDGKSTYLSPEAEFIKADMQDKATLGKALDGVDMVVNLAAEVGVGQSMYEITRYMNANTGGTAVLLELLASGMFNVNRMVVASSMSVYGEGLYVCEEHGELSPDQRSEEQLKAHKWEVICPDCGQQLKPIATKETKKLSPSSIYAISKLDQESMSINIGRAYGIATVALRLFNAFGPRQALSNPYTGVAAIFSSRLLNNQTPMVFEDSLQRRDFVHVQDVARAFVAALEAKKVMSVICNIGTGKSVSIGEVARTLAKELGSELTPEVTQQYRVGDIRHCWADTTQARNLLGFEAEYSLESHAGELAAWVKNQTSKDQVRYATEELKNRGLVL